MKKQKIRNLRKFRGGKISKQELEEEIRKLREAEKKDKKFLRKVAFVGLGAIGLFIGSRLWDRCMVPKFTQKIDQLGNLEGSEGLLKKVGRFLDNYFFYYLNTPLFNRSKFNVVAD